MSYFDKSKKSQAILKARTHLDRKSFLLNPQGLVEDKQATIHEKCVYIRLASFRRYVEYQRTNDTSVPIYIVQAMTDFDIERLKQNSLLIINEKTIRFKYEEI